MCKIVLTIAFLFLSSITAFAQNREQQKPALAYRVTERQRWAFRFEENPLFDYDKVLRHPETIVAIRFCSKESLGKVLASSERQVDVVRNFLEQAYDYTPERILILRSADCLDERASISATELWVIPEGAKLPSATETIKSSQLPKTGNVKNNRRSSRPRRKQHHPCK